MPAYELEDGFIELSEYQPKNRSCSKVGCYNDYENRKREIEKMNLSCTDYQHAIQVLAEELNL